VVLQVIDSQARETRKLAPSLRVRRRLTRIATYEISQRSRKEQTCGFRMQTIGDWAAHVSLLVFQLIVFPIAVVELVRLGAIAGFGCGMKLELVAESHGRLVGCVTIRRSRKGCVWVTGVVVAKPHRRRCVSTALLVAAIREVQQEATRGRVVLRPFSPVHPASWRLCRHLPQRRLWTVRVPGRQLDFADRAVVKEVLLAAAKRLQECHDTFVFSSPGTRDLAFACAG